MDNQANPDCEADEVGKALESLHDRLVAAGSAETPPGGAAAFETVLDERLRADQACLELIERVRRRYGESLEPLLRGDSPIDLLPETDWATAGEAIGRFQVLRELGRGGHGIVLLAHDPVLGRDVALKVPRVEALFAPELRARFLREARAAGRLTHPNIVPVYEVGQAGPICYIASEYCRGPTLSDWLRAHAGRVPPRVAARIICDLAAAVAYAHSQGVLHRDLKPSNVLLSRLDFGELSRAEAGGGRPEGIHDEDTIRTDPPDEADLRPKLTDFGLAKLSESADHFTRTGVVMGTPAYMAPEQADGRLAEVGPRTDVYALGAVLYELLAGLPPFEGTSDADTLRRVVADEPAPPRQVRAELPRDLEAIALKCLEKRPDRRYATAADLADDVRRFLGGEATLARPLGPLTRTIRWARRHPAAATLCAAITATMTLAFAGGLWHLSRLSEALEQTRQAQGETLRREYELRQHIYLGDLKLAHQAWQRSDVQQAVELLLHHVPKPGERDVRGFFWRHLSWLCHGDPRTLSGHQGHVYHVAFSPDGKTLASGGADRTIRLWEVNTLRPRATLVGHTSEVNCLVFSPDGATLASADDHGTVRLWNTTTASESGVLPRRTGMISTLTFTPDGQTLISAGSDKLITLWDLASRTVRATLEGHTDKVACLAVSQDAALLASGSTDETARLWDLASGEMVAVLLGHYQTIRSIAFSHDAKLVATTGVDSSVRLWKVPTGEEIAVLAGHRRRVSSVAFSADDKLLISAGEDQTVRIWDVASRTAARAYHAAQGRIWCLACSPREDLCATAGADGTVKLFRYGDGREYVYPEWLSPTRIYGVHCLNGGFAAISNGASECIQVDLNAQRWQPIAPAPPNQLAGLAVTPDGAALAVADARGNIELWDVPTRKVWATLRRHTSILRCLAFDQNGTLLATAGEAPDHAIRLWDVSAARLLQTFDGGEFDTECLAFSPRGHLLASGNRDSVVRMWVINERMAPVELRGHQTIVRAVSFSPDGRLLASASDDSTVRLWDVESRRDLGLILRHPDRVGSVIFCPDDPLVITGCDDGVVRLWSISSGELLAELRGHAGGITHLAFDPAGRWLASSAADSEHPLLLWMSPEAIVRGPALARP